MNNEMVIVTVLGRRLYREEDTKGDDDATDTATDTPVRAAGRRLRWAEVYAKVTPSQRTKEK